MSIRKKRYFSAGFSCRVISFFMIALPLTSLLAQDTLSSIHVSVDVKNRSISQILDEFTLQTGFYFTYDASLIPRREKMNFIVSNLDINHALDSLLQNEELRYRLIDKNIVIFRENSNIPVPDETLPGHTILRGKIVSKKSGKPLPYATIGLYGTHLGAISNHVGDFSFKLPVEIEDPLLVVTFMGYKNQYFPINYPTDEPVTIELEQNLISLQEVIIRYQDPVALLTEAIERIPENYLSEHARMTAFYKESVKRNDHCMILSEAVLDIAKSPYDKDFVSDKVRVFKGRKIMDVTVEDTILLKIKSGIYTSLGLDIIKNPPDFLSESFTDLYIFDLSDIVSYGDKLVYEIRFSPRSHIQKTLFKGHIYIDIKTLALVGVDFSYDPEKIHREQGLFVISKSRNIRIRPIQAKYHVDYRNLNGMYYISQVRAYVDLKIRRRRKWIGARYNIGIEMAITDIFPGERLRIDPDERVKPSVVMSDESFEYDPLFWGVYNIIEPGATIEESLSRIEKSMQEYLNAEYPE